MTNFNSQNEDESCRFTFIPTIAQPPRCVVVRESRSTKSFVSLKKKKAAQLRCLFFTLYHNYFASLLRMLRPSAFQPHLSRHDRRTSGNGRPSNFRGRVPGALCDFFGVNTERMRTRFNMQPSCMCFVLSSCPNVCLFCGALGWGEMGGVRWIDVSILSVSYLLVALLLRVRSDKYPNAKQKNSTRLDK